MAQVSILSGIYSDMAADFRTTYPKNMYPIPKQNGISAGYLKNAEGVELFGTGPGVDRGGIVWNNVHYRVMGTKLVSISNIGVVTTLGDVGGIGQVSLDYSFDNLIIGSGGKLFYWNGSVLTQVTDVDLGTVVDCLWVDGYTMTTDGEFLVVTELNDPFAVDPLKYGSSEVEPDPIVGLRKIRNEVYALNRHTIEVFDNTGGSGFPFGRIDGAQITKGCVGTYAACIVADTLAFMGNGRNEAVAIYMGAGGQIRKVSDDELEKRLKTYTEAQIAAVLLESRKFDNHEFLYVHLPNETWVFDIVASAVLQQQIWFTLHSDIDANGAYTSRNFVLAYGQWICGNTLTANLGKLKEDIPTQYGEMVGWQFDTALLYNSSKGAIVHSLELVALTGRAPMGRNPQVFYSYTNDGLTWSNERVAGVGMRGDFRKRLAWMQCGQMQNYRSLRFRGANDTLVAFARLEAELEPLFA